ncbi:Predicted esterase [Nannocystis exedens]|uniref:Predicted esterase n=1 Tax=Nannocystis exedens TaxID=54 RepID=A0A1I2IYL4_9BACT|nr:dienelactone hydrolase family protein [Nannocystis exedens]PCC69324.1 putative hydrolase [Nannocystis exedens]SFF45766.1 Predicted esterase [Nannocystis exedens]
MKRVVVGGLAAAGVVGAGIWLKRQAVRETLFASEPDSQVPLVIPGRVAVERLFGGGDARTKVPLVLVLHGVGADETQLAPYVLSNRPMRLVFLRGGLASGNGFQWFRARYKDNAAAFITDVSRTASEIVTVLDQIATQRLYTERIVVGYSQGAHIAWWLATSGRVDRVVAMSGALPASFKPPRPTRQVRIEAAHGLRDPVIPYSAGQATARAFQGAGYPVRLTTLRLAGHGLSSMGAALAPALEGALSNGAVGLATKSSSLGAR